MKFFEKQVPNAAFLISKGVTISGGLEGSLSGRIEGLIKGDVKINGKVIVSETGIVEGSLKCYELVVHGVIHGDAIAHNSIVVGSGGVIHGNVSSNSIVVDPKSRVKGVIKKFRLTGDNKEIPEEVQVKQNTKLDPNPNSRKKYGVITDFQRESDSKERFW